MVPNIAQEILNPVVDVSLSNLIIRYPKIRIMLSSIKFVNIMKYKIAGGPMPEYLDVPKIKNTSVLIKITDRGIIKIIFEIKVCHPFLYVNNIIYENR